MINLYAYTYNKYKAEYKDCVLIKFGATRGSVLKRMKQQGETHQPENKIKLFEWLNLKKIKWDTEIHEILKLRGFHHKTLAMSEGNSTEGIGEEWYRIPAKGSNPLLAIKYLDDIVTELEGERVRPRLVIRQAQQRASTQAMDIISTSKEQSTIVANLCPRFGKTIWGLHMFNQITNKYGNRVMVLPAYWLGSHTSFEDELDRYADFQDIRLIDGRDLNAAETAQKYLDTGLRIMILVSLHGDIDAWKEQYRWISKIPNETIFNFADEGDFGTHTDNQRVKLDFIFNHDIKFKV